MYRYSLVKVLCAVNFRLCYKSQLCAGAAAGEGADFWRALLPDAVKAAELAEKNRGIVSGPRRRRAINYNEDKIHKDAEEKAKAEVCS